MIGFDQYSCSALGPISTGMDKPSQYINSQSGQLSLAIRLSVGTLSTSKS